MNQIVADWPRKTRELHNHHMDSTQWNDFPFRDDDDLNPSDRWEVAPFRLGWRRDVTIRLTGAEAEVNLVIALQPI